MTTLNLPFTVMMRYLLDNDVAVVILLMYPCKLLKLPEKGPEKLLLDNVEHLQLGYVMVESGREACCARASTPEDSTTK